MIPDTSRHVDSTGGHDFRALAIRSGFITAIGQIIRLAIQFGGALVLARMLAPEDYGLIGMMAVFTGFLGMLSDLGLSSAIIQTSEVSDEQLSTLFWINVAAATILAGTVIGAGPFISRIYREPRLSAIALAVAPTFLIVGLSVQHQSVLRRRMRFLPLALSDCSSALLGQIASIALAAAGLGYWALIAGPFVAATTNTIAVWLACDWRPGRPSPIAGVRKLLAFGRNLSVFSFSNYFARNLDNGLIGWRFGPTELGLYARAYQLMLLPVWQLTAPVTAVAVPTLSRLKDDPARHRNYYLKAVKAIAYVTVPLLLLCAVLARPLTFVLLGPKWVGASPILRALAVAGLSQPVFTTVGWLWVSLDRTAAMAKWGIASSLIICSSFVAGLRWGGEGVAVAYCIVIWLLLVPAFVIATQGSLIRPRDVLHSVLKPALLAVVMSSPCVFMTAVLSGLTPGGLLLLCLLAALISGGVAILFLRTLRDDLITCVRDLTHAFKQSANPG